MWRPIDLHLVLPLLGLAPALRPNDSSLTASYQKEFAPNDLLAQALRPIDLRLESHLLAFCLGSLTQVCLL